MEPASKLWKQSAGRRHGQAVGMVVRRPSYLQKVPKPLEDKGKILSGLIFLNICGIVPILIFLQNEEEKHFLIQFNLQITNVLLVFVCLFFHEKHQFGSCIVSKVN